MHAITNDAIRPLINFLAILGVNRAACFEAMGLTEQMFDRSQSLFVGDYEKLYKFAERALPDSLIGFHYGQHIDNDRWGVLGQIAFSSSNLQQALNFQQKYQSLMGSFGTPIYHVKHGKLVLNWVPSERVNHHIAEEVITGWVALGRRLTGENLQPDYIEFTHPAPNDEALMSEYTLFFDCPVYFDRANNSLSIDADILALPCSRADHILNSSLIKLADKMLNAVSQIDPLKVTRQFIRNGLPHGLPTIKELSAHLGTSERSLQRKLSEFNSSFSKELDLTRQELAKTCLTNSDMTLTDISSHLAFSEQSAFIRAFKRWYGVTPAQFRKTVN